MSLSERHRPPSVPSTVSLHHHNPSRASRRAPPPLAKVVVVPPWARDEPPSPHDEEVVSSSHDNHAAYNSQSPPNTSDSISFQTNPEGASRWWSFTLPRVRDQYSDLRSNSPSSQRPIRRGFREKSISWLQASTSLKETVSGSPARREKDLETGDQLSIPIPSELPPPTPGHVQTPGWFTPWSARLEAQGPNPQFPHDSTPDLDEDNRDSPQDEPTGWAAKKKRMRSFILSNPYVPLLFRFINISFTTAALGMAIHIRQIELHTHTMGAVGSSPTVVIIFAPLTLVHVMAAIYVCPLHPAFNTAHLTYDIGRPSWQCSPQLEYFGRPLGLWRTSGKLAHTLSEVLFICAWSASLSLCFDNFFTSLIPCASASSLTWYNELPRPEFNLPDLEGSAGKELCESQLALICLVGVGLVAYCTNLVISLYRIFEKVKLTPRPHQDTHRTS